MRFWSLLAAGLGLGLSGSADAQTLEYNWTPGESLQYRVQAYVKAPRVLRFYASENLDARVVELTIFPGPTQNFSPSAQPNPHAIS